MKFIYDEQMTKEVVQKYFKENESIDGELTISCTTRKQSLFGRPFVEYDVPYISFRLKGILEIEGTNHPVELVVSKEEIEAAFTTTIEASGRKVKHISMDYDETKFNHIVIEVTSKRKVK